MQLQENAEKRDNFWVDSIVVSVFVVILVGFGKYRIWDKQACLALSIILGKGFPKIHLHSSNPSSQPNKTQQNEYHSTIPDISR